MGYLFTDLGAEGCCRSLNALFKTVKPFLSNKSKSTGSGNCLSRVRQQDNTVDLLLIGIKTNFINET